MISLIKRLARKAVAPVEVEEGVTPPAVPVEELLTEVLPNPIEPPEEKPVAKALSHFTRFKITVPAGHLLPEGTPVKDRFPITVEVGVRWHPEWDGPRVCVNAYRFFPHGDCLCWAGQTVIDAYGVLLPPDVGLLATYHGQPYPAEGGDEDSLIVRVAIKSMGITPPTEKEKLAAFILPEQLGSTRH